MKVKALFPGAMKPFHDGHWNAMRSLFLNSSDDCDDCIESFLIIMSSKDRSGITAKTSSWILDQADFNSWFPESVEVDFKISENASPISECYQIIGSSDYENDHFTLVTSSKGTDYKRLEKIVYDFSNAGKYYKGSDDLVISASSEFKPLRYSNRHDEFDGKPVSASIARMDVLNCDFDKFKTSYALMLSDNLIDEKTLFEYFQMLQKECVETPADLSKREQMMSEKIAFDMKNSNVNWCSVFS